MILLELFAGTRSIGKEAEKVWYEVYSLENDPSFECNMTMSVLDFVEIEGGGAIPDIIWASPPCTTYSVASISHHRFPWGNPRTKEAELWDALVLKTIEIIRKYEALNPKLVWFIENPRWMLRKMPFMQDFKRHTVTYCQYGDTRMKPTDIWTNSTSWTPKEACKNWMTCHVSAPRGSKTWTQWIKWSKDRSVIPQKLCEEIVRSTL